MFIIMKHALARYTATTWLLLYALALSPWTLASDVNEYLPKKFSTVHGDTPGNYSRYEFTNTAGLNNVNTTFRALSDPGRLANVFWALEFGFVGNPVGAYVGIQTNGFRNERTIIFSVWNTTEAQPGDPESYCTTFTGEGRGRSCRMRYAWAEGKDYQFNVTMEQGGWVRLSFTDVSAGKTFNVGRIRNGASQINPLMGNWAEYFEWSSPHSNCYNQPYSRARFEVPYEQTGNTRKTAIVKEVFSEPNSCKDMAKAEHTGNHVEFTAGIGNSIRGPIISFNQQIINRIGTSFELIPQSTLFSSLVLSKDGLFTDSLLCIDHDGSNVHGRGCSAVSQQRWVTEPMRNGGFWIRHPPSNSCLDHENGSPGLNRAIVPRPCVAVESDSQRWYLMPGNKLGVANECITLQDNFRLKTEQCAPGVRSQYWYSYPAVPEGAGWTLDKLGMIRLLDNSCLTDENWNVVSQVCENTASNQKWQYDPIAKTLRSSLGNRACMAVDNNRKVVLQTCNGAQNQQWTVPIKP